MGIWSRKTVDTLCGEALGEGPQQLKRSLGIVGLTAFGVGCTIGAGIFSLTGDVAAHRVAQELDLGAEIEVERRILVRQHGSS